MDIVDGVPDEYFAASRKVSGGHGAEWERQVRAMFDRMARAAIQPVWARFFDFGAGRMPSFWTKLPGGAQQATGAQRRRTLALRCGFTGGGYCVRTCCPKAVAATPSCSACSQESLARPSRLSFRARDATPSRLAFPRL